MEIAWLGKTHARIGWSALILAAGSVAVGLAVNESTYAGGYIYLEDADWRFYADNLPKAWIRVEASDTFSRLNSAAPELRARLDVLLRQLTGIRWTPSRFRIWFGDWLVVSGKGREVIAFVRPNRIAQVALSVAERRGRVHHEGKLQRIGDFYLLASDADWFVGTSPDIIDKYIAQLQPAASSGTSAAEAAVQLDSNTRLSAVFDEEFQFTLERVTVDASSTPGSSHLWIDWPEKPVVAVSTRDFGLWQPLFPDNWPDFPGSGDLKKVWSEFEKLLPPNWRLGADTTQFALFGVDTSENVPVPDAAVYARSDTPLPVLTPPPNAIPYEWSGNAGWMTPWLGEGANLFVATGERSRVFTNQEVTMSKIMAHERSGRITSDDASIEIDMTRLARILTELARKAARDELLPERNADDVERDIIPWLNALGAIGEIELTGKYENGALLLRGGTTPPPASSAKRQ